MRLHELASALEGGAMPRSGVDPEVLGIAHDSRKAGAGSLFVAVRGFHSDGHRFVPQAVRQGAVAVVAEEGSAVDAGPSMPVIRVGDSRKALAKLAAKFYDYPSTKLRVVGITGTKGKTTTSYLVRSVIESAGATAGLIGTIDYRVGPRVIPAPNTTPESLELQELLAEMLRSGATHCVMEVSSHALALGRTDECVFEAAAFTNLAHEHLDFHASMDDYFQAKLKLFAGLGPDKTAVVNRDDVRSAEVLRRTRAKVITYGSSRDADVRTAGMVAHDSTGLRFTAATPIGEIKIDSRLVGSYNVHNILAAVGLGIALGFTRDAIAEGIRNMPSVPGRMESIDEGQPFSVIVDYAHTEASLAAVLRAVGDIGGGHIITLFGCGGDRDRTKRPKMGAAALAGSDIVIVTSDNPRTEDPQAIIREVESGMQEAGVRVNSIENRLPASAGTKPYLIIPDRHDAIDAAIGLALPGDVVVLAGKGHEDYQIIGERKLPFDDREEARKAIRKRQAAGFRGHGSDTN